MSPAETFEVSIQDLLPVINKLREENEHLLSHKSSMEVELAQLARLQEVVVGENEALRQHYY